MDWILEAGIKLFTKFKLGSTTDSQRRSTWFCLAGPHLIAAEVGVINSDHHDRTPATPPPVSHKRHNAVDEEWLTRLEVR